MTNGRAPKRLLVEISGHGFGHLAQMSPVIAALRELREIDLVLRCAHPEERVAQFIAPPFRFETPAADIGCVMSSPSDVDRTATWQAYRALHEGWSQNVATEAERLRSQAPDLVVSDVGYLVLAAASEASIPALAISSLSWSEVFDAYCGGEPGAARVKNQIDAAYRSTRGFIQVTPHLPMQGLGRLLPVGPVGRVVPSASQELRARLSLASDTRLALVSLGGIEGGQRLQLPRLEKLAWIVPSRWLPEMDGARDDMIASETIGLPFHQLLASADVMLTKPGYGSYVEAALNGVRILTFARPDWPEMPYLAAWLEQNAVATLVERDTAERGDYQADLDALLKQPVLSRPAASGIGETVQILYETMG